MIYLNLQVSDIPDVEMRREGTFKGGMRDSIDLIDDDFEDEPENQRLGHSDV